MPFIHNSPHLAGFYRDRDSAIAEGVAIKRNAAGIPDRPPETAQAIRARRKQALLDQKSLQQTWYDHFKSRFNIQN